MIDASAFAVPVSRLTATEGRPPGSKSITNRALLVAALAEGKSTLVGALDAEDSRIMLDALNALGVAATLDANTRVATVTGASGAFPNRRADLYVGNSGTTARFLTAALAFARDGEYRIDGKPRMRERPIGDLLKTLRSLGADVVSENGNDCPPLKIQGRHIGAMPEFPERATIAADVSSQFLSGLLMAAPLAARDFEIAVDGPLASKPYVKITLATMRAFGVAARADADFRVFSGFTNGAYVGREYQIEPDASAASYFFALPAILGGSMTIRGLSRNALQGDVEFAAILEKMGCVAIWRDDSITVERPRLADGVLAPLHGIDVDMNACSDLVQTLSVVALFADSPTTIRNVANIRVKETDRLAAVVTELRKLGATVQENVDGLVVVPPARLHGATIATYDDHRMAMSFALAGLRTPGVVIENPGCVAKTYPNFFEDIAEATTPDPSFWRNRDVPPL